MLLGSIQIQGESLASSELRDINTSLTNHSIRLLSLRNCHIRDADLQKVLQAVGSCKSILQLNLNLHIINSLQRIHMLANALQQNRSLNTLYLHGSTLKEHGCHTLVQALSGHPNIVSLDLGDCQLTDSSIVAISSLLPPNGAKRGLHELILSGNPAVTSAGWTKFFMALGAGCELKSLYLDYTQLGDQGMACLAVALSHNTTLEVLDLEAAGISKHGAEVLLHLVRKYPVKLKTLVLTGNHFHHSYITAIQSHLQTKQQPEAQKKVPLSSSSSSSESSPESANEEGEEESEEELKPGVLAPGTIITGPTGGGRVVPAHQVKTDSPKPHKPLTGSEKPKSVVLPDHLSKPTKVEHVETDSEVGTIISVHEEKEENSEASLTPSPNSEYSDNTSDDDDDVVISKTPGKRSS